ncbi:hypothetical protein AWV80_38620 [Cupriavidus sp. UYMU48A]|nr:hypothetical protein AWV80_38620 [Cupriavidus sp. UYMU48A]
MSWTFPDETGNARFVMVELRGIEDGAYDEVRILEAILLSEFTEIAPLKLPDVEHPTRRIDWIAVPMPRGHKLRDLARTDDLFHLNDFQDSLIGAIACVRNRDIHFVLHFSLDAASAAAEKEDAISWMVVWIIPEELAGGNIRAFALWLPAHPQVPARVAEIHSRNDSFLVRLHFSECLDN